MVQKSITNAVKEMSTRYAVLYHITAIGLGRKGKRHTSPLTCATKNGHLDMMKCILLLISPIVLMELEKFSNVAFGPSFQIYALKRIKKGTELLLNYNRQMA